MNFDVTSKTLVLQRYQLGELFLPLAAVKFPHTGGHIFDLNVLLVVVSFLL